MKLGNTRRKSLDTFDICKFYHSELKRVKRPQNMPFNFSIILEHRTGEGQRILNFLLIYSKQIIQLELHDNKLDYEIKNY